MTDAIKERIIKTSKDCLNAQATDQSEVIGFPIARSCVTPLNKDHYRASLDDNQQFVITSLLDFTL